MTPYDASRLTSLPAHRPGQRPPELACDLVLEGGGVLGIAHVGAISTLADAGYSFGRIAGSSVGSLVGALLTGGIEPRRMREVLGSLDFASLTDKSLLDRVPVVGPAASILLDDGVYEGARLRSLVAQLLREECGVETFGDLRVGGDDLPLEQRWRLVVTVTDTTRGELVRLPWDYERLYGLDPDEQRVADAVRASASIPFFFEPIRLRATTGLESVLVDGGVLSNFPIDLLDRRDGRRPERPTFGIKLLPTLPAGGQKLLPGLGMVQHGPLRLAADLVTTALVGRDQQRLSLPWVAARTIRVDTSGVGPVDFDIRPAQVEALLTAGATAARKFLDSWDWEAYLARFRTVDRS